VRVRDHLGRARHEAPLTVSYLEVIAATSGVLLAARAVDPKIYRRILLAQSTNLDGLSTHPIFVTMSSAFWVEHPYLLPSAAFVAAVGIPLERRIGAASTAGVFTAGHVGATLLVAAGLAVGRAAGLVDTNTAAAIDVGASYGVAAAAFVLFSTLPHRWRRPATAVLLMVLVGTLAHSRDFSAAGHLLAGLIGIGCARLLGRAPRKPPVM
jgi:hypothetical protein